MSRPILICIILAGVVVLGGAAFVLTRDSRADEPDSTSASQTEENGSKTFNPIPTESESFEATLTGTAEGDSYNATILHDGKGATKYSSTMNGQNIEFYVSNETLISCQDGSCVEVAQNSVFDQGSYSYTEEDFNRFRETAEYLGKEPCPAGICDAWEVEDGDSKYITKVYLADDRRVSKLTASSPAGASAEIVYTYKDVTVEVPENVRTL